MYFNYTVYISDLEDNVVLIKLYSGPSRGDIARYVSNDIREFGGLWGDDYGVFIPAAQIRIVEVKIHEGQ